MPRTTALAAIAALCLSHVPALADVITVKQDGTGDYTSIQAAIDVAVLGDSIEVGPGTFRERLTVSDKTLEIRSTAEKGESTVIDAEDTGRLLYLSGAKTTLTLRNLTLINGTASTGGGIYASQANIILDACTLEGHDASGVGGGVYLSNSSSIAATATTIANCISSDKGGGIYAENNCRLSLGACTFTANQAYTHAGAIALGSGIHLIADCIFTQNGLTYTSSSNTYGSAVRADGSTIGFTNCTFDSNTQNLSNYDQDYRYGGAVALLGGSSAIFTGGSFDSNAASHGGAIYATGSSSVSLQGTSFDGNTAGYAGGALEIQNSSTLVADGVDLASNTARQYGGAVRIGSSVTHTLTNCTFTGNSLSETSSNTASGAGLYANGLVQMAGCTFDGNTADIENDAYARYGGGAYLDVDTGSTVTSCTFTNNFSGTGGGLWMSQGLVLGSSFTGNTAGLRGGGAHSDSNVQFELCQFTSNTCDIRYDENYVGGGGAYLNAGTLVDCTFTQNSFRNEYTSYDYSGGGAVFARNMSLELDDCTFINNTATWIFSSPSYFGGGGIYAYNAIITASGDTSFTGNEVVFNGPSQAQYSGGGAMMLVSSSMTLDTIDFTNNAVRLGSTYADYFAGGGAVFTLDGSRTDLSNCTFTDNLVTSDTTSNTYAGGGAIMTGDGMNLTGCTLSGNRAIRQPTNPDSNLSGGAVWIFPNSSSTFTNTTFSDNEADQYGGAVYSRDSGNTYLDSCTLTGNAAGSTGGGIYGSSTVYLANSLYCDNAPNNYAGNISDQGGNDFQGHCEGSDTTISVPDEYATIAEAVRHALSGDLIEVAAGTYGGTIDLTNRDVSLTGLDGAAKTIIDLEGGNLRGIYAPNQEASGTISGFTVRNAQATGLAGLGMYVRGPMTIEDCAFEDLELRNQNDTDGGAGLYIETGSGQTATVRNCTFTNCVIRNTQGSYGYSGGGGIYHHSGDLDVEGCTFTGCEWRQETSSPEYSGGGGIYHYQGTLTLASSGFDGCTTTFVGGNSSDYFMQGGAIRIQGGLVDSIDACTFTDCTSARQGGAIYLYTHDDGLSISNSTFLRCTSVEVDGGAIYVDNGYRLVANACDFTECSSANHGGALYLSGSPNTLDSCTFDQCLSQSRGGGIYASSGDCSLESCLFTDCSATSRGGGFYSSSNSHQFANCEFTRCFASDGGGIYASGSSQNLDGCSFTECSVSDDGGGCWLGNSSSILTCTFTNNSTISASNSNCGGGAYLLEYGNVQDSVFSGNRCERTQVDGQDSLGGGAIRSDHRLSVARTSFVGNTVQIEGASWNNSGESYKVGGGAIHSTYDLQIDDQCLFEGNRVVLKDLRANTSGGGAILYALGYVNGSYFTISDATFTDNEVILEGNREYSQVGGGAIHRDAGSDISLEMTDCTLTGNRFLGTPRSSSSSGGGAVWISGQEPRFTNCDFIDNSTESSSTDVDRFFNGGAIYASNSYTKLNGCDFAANHCGGDGGAVWLGSNDSVEVDDCTFTGNGAYQGPAGALRIPGTSGGGVTNCTACSNAPSNFGDLQVDDLSNTIAVRCDGDTPVVQVPAEYDSIAKAVRFAFDGDTIEIGPGTWNEAIEFLGRDLSLIGTDGAENTIIDATGWGRPAIVADRADGIGTITGLTLTGADANGSFGGGARLAGSMTVSDCVITGNRVQVGDGEYGGGAGIAFTTPGASVTLDTVTISDNHLVSGNEGDGFVGWPAYATGAGIHATVGFLQMSDCLIETNRLIGTGSGAGGGLYAESATITITDSILRANEIELGDGGNAHLQNCATVATNTDLIDGVSGQNAGGIHTSAGSFDLADGLIQGNTASNTGGGIYSAGTAWTLTNATIDQNTAGTAGGGRFESSSLVVSNGLVTGNLASGEVGGLDLEDMTTPVIEDSTILGNAAGGNAGGLRLSYIYGENGARIERCTILDNVAGGAGGGLRIENIETKVTVVDGIIGENRAEVGGGINALETRQLTLQNVAVYNNHAELFGGGLYDEGSGGGLQETVINETTISGNTAGAVGGGIYLLLREMAISNTGFCGNDPGQIIGFWTDYGGNTFQDGTCFFDCNGNGVEDGTEIGEGQLQDCDQNGVPDLCEIADGSAEDCDGDGIPDVCTKGGFVTATSGTLPAFGVGVPQGLPLTGTPAAGGPVTITVEAIGDLSSELEFGIVTVNDVEVGTLFEIGEDCGGTALVGSLVVDAEIFNLLTVAGPAEIAVTGSIAVDATFCPEGSTRITIDYLRTADGDCNENGLLDQCEIAGGFAEDCDGNGIPDDCEIDGGMAADCNGNGQLDGCEIAAGEVEDDNGDGIPDSCQCVFDLDGNGEVGGGDVGIFLGFWGTNEPAADFDGDGAVRAGDLGLLLAAFGSCP